MKGLETQRWTSEVTHFFLENFRGALSCRRLLPDWIALKIHLGLLSRLRPKTGRSRFSSEMRNGLGSLLGPAFSMISREYDRTTPSRRGFSSPYAPAQLESPPHISCGYM